MPGVPREVIEHCLNVKEGAKPVKQRLRRFAQDRKEAIRDELSKLTAANFIREVYHPDWLANPVLVKKKNGKWRMCVDYTDLNKSVPQRSVRTTPNRSGCRFYSRIRAIMLP